MKAIILAAGRGSRMCDATASMPKCMMKLWGRPIIDLCISSLKRAGFVENDIGIVVGYRGEIIKDRYPDLTFFENNQWNNTNMVYSLSMAEKWLDNQECIICYSDIVFSSFVIKKLMSCHSNISLPYFTDFLKLWTKRFENPLDDLETFKLDSKENLIEIGKKPSSLGEIEGQFMGILKITPSGWSDIKKILNGKSTFAIEKSDMTTLLNDMVLNGSSIRCMKSNEEWIECDNINDVKLYNREYDIGMFI